MEIGSDFLATLATKAELAAAIAPLPTRDEMNAAIAAAVAPLPTRDEMNAAIAAAMAPLATHEEVREEGERTRRYFDVVAERLETSIKLIAEGHVDLDRKIDNVRQELTDEITRLDRRVTRLETRRRTR